MHIQILAGRLQVPLPARRGGLCDALQPGVRSLLGLRVDLMLGGWMSFEEEWAQLRAEADRRRRDSLQLASSDTPGPGPTGAPNLYLDDDPVRTKAKRVHDNKGENKAKLDDAETPGRTHKGWDAGAASNECVAAWQKRLREFSDVIDDAADALTKAMDKQISEDYSVYSRMRKAADWMEHS
ncbi:MULTISPECIES: hypothetical protein [Streptomyces]|uniref:hypothetical protein n=2 Tax=Streptomyces TaxID=1883 RepID=UPI001CECCDAE|nr:MULTISPECIES: hypothetical protein [Streptomyces]